MTFSPNWRDPRGDLPDDHNDLPEDERYRLMAERCRLLHIYGQASWHGTARIVGNRNALIVLRDAIDAALSEGKAETSASTTDGEGYGVEIELVDAAWESPAWETRPPSYIDPIARGEPDPWTAVADLRFALRQANAQLVKRGVRPVEDATKKDDAQ